MYTFPMIVVEEESSLEVRDCYLRSIRKDNPPPLPQSDDSNYQMVNEMLKTQLSCEEIGIFTEPVTWNESSTTYNHKTGVHRDVLTVGEERKRNAKVYIKSCIFFNFYDQVRLGVDTSVFLERCHMSEARNNAVHALNPCILKIEGCNFSKPSKHGVLCEWLPLSSMTEKCRRLTIEGCDFNFSGSSSILVQPSKGDLLTSCAHNLGIDILNNKIARARGEGLTVLNMVLAQITIQGNEFTLNQFHNVYLKHVHQKSNKCASATKSYLLMKGNKLW